LKVVKEQLRGIPNQGIGYGLLRYLRDDKIEETLETLLQAEVIFNYWVSLIRRFRSCLCSAWLKSLVDQPAVCKANGVICWKLMGW